MFPSLFLKNNRSPNVLFMWGWNVGVSKCLNLNAMQSAGSLLSVIFKLRLIHNILSDHILFFKVLALLVLQKPFWHPV